MKLKREECKFCNAFNGCFWEGCHCWHDVMNLETHLAYCDIRSYMREEGIHRSTEDLEAQMLGGKTAIRL